MSLHLTHEMMEAAYELLLHTPPFKRWKLPGADEIQFEVMEGEHHSADYVMLAEKTHRIRINNRWVGTVAKLVACLAHEMVHMRLKCNCADDQAWAGHDEPFQKLAAQVCRHHDMSMKGF